MKTKTKRRFGPGVVVLAAALAGCSGNEAATNSSPVQLLVTNTQTVSQIDIAPGAMNCARTIGTIQLSSLLKNPITISQQQFNNVRISSYRVSYIRTDGGTQVPTPFVRSLDALVTTGGAQTSVSNFLILTSDALVQAPFAALSAVNGGRDPETGRPNVQMDVIVEVFGETLAGEKVSGSTRFPLTFCFSCGGCS